MAELIDNFSIGEWNRMKENRDQALENWERTVHIKKCRCGMPYSYGYPPVEDDPGECQSCRGAEGELF